jgi:AcrR family transcriptional regulator
MLSRRAEASLGVRHRSILEGLEKLMRDGELATLTIGEMASRLECSRRALYELAPSKDQLILLVLDRVMHRIGEIGISAIDFTAPAKVQLRQYATASLSYVWRSSAIDDLSGIEGAERVREIHHRFAGTLFERIVATGIDRGEFRHCNSSVAAAVILASAVRFASPEVLDDLGLSLEDAIDEMLNLILGGLVGS